MIKTIIIDDESDARDMLEKMLSKFFPNKFLVLDKCESVDSALISIEKNQPELVFLDVQMPEKNGFELIKELKEINFELIFTTAHIQFAINAIKCSALDYLLKPITQIDLSDAIKKYESKSYKIQQQERLVLLLENLDLGNSEFSKVAFHTDSGIELVKVNTILYCEADVNYCNIYCLNDKKLTLSKPLKYIESLLPKSIFQRIHKSYLVNLNYVSRFNKLNDYQVELVNGLTLPVSFRQKENLIYVITKKK